jgi:transposase
VLGASGRAMLERLIVGETDPVALADLAQQQLRAKLPALQAALRGSVGPHQRFLLRQQLRHIDQLETQMAEVNAEITRRLQAPAASPPEPVPPAETRASAPPPPAPSSAAPAVPSGADAVARLDTIPGVGRRVAEVLVAEIGTDMRRFPSAAHLASWAGLCPGHHESAGRRLSGRTRRGNPTLRSTLREAARAAARTQTYLGAQFHRVAARRGTKRAAVAVAHSILVIAYHLLRDGTAFEDLGTTYFDERDRARVTQRLVQRLRALGVPVAISPAAT